MTTKKIMDEVEQTFFQKLEAKTNWGRNDVKALYKDAQLEVLKNAIDQPQSNDDYTRN